MQHEPQPRKTLAEDRQDTFGVVNVVERHDRIISEPDKGAIPRKAWSYLRFEPFIEHMVQKNVREAGGDHTPLRSALSRTVQETIFDSSCFQPFVNHPSNNAVCDNPEFPLRAI